MRIGYPCINRSIGCRSDRKFRLVSFHRERFFTTVASNISCLLQILEWNLFHDILFFRISSDIIPFASHQVCTFPWQKYFADELALIGGYISESGIRISMHPDQFIVINSPDETIVSRSTNELAYHATLLDLMELDSTAKIQLHVGGLYGNPRESIARFIRVYNQMDPAITRRLVVENDDQRFTAADCLEIHEQTGIPVLFDSFHHSCNNNGEGVRALLQRIGETWKSSDGIPMVDYSSQHPEKRAGGHAEHIDINDFQMFLELSKPYDSDIMLEIKDKEASALAAIALARGDPRFVCTLSKDEGS
jgi:UV DNA damage endonuclease